MRAACPEASRNQAPGTSRDGASEATACGLGLGGQSSAKKHVRLSCFSLLLLGYMRVINKLDLPSTASD
jgi:hypothetical protein